MSLPSRIAPALLTSVCALSVTLPAAPARAIALAGSRSDLFFGNFSHDPIDTSTFSDTFTFTSTDRGLTIAEAEANAVFVDPSFSLDQPTVAFNNFANFASTEGGTSIAIASSEARILGDFQIDATLEPIAFSFDFEGSLGIFGEVDSSPGEQASATATIFWGIFDQIDDQLVPIDFFDLSAGLETFSDRDFLSLQATEHVDLFADGTFLGTDFDSATEGALTEGAIAEFAGRYQRTFATSRTLRLVEFKQGEAVASVPEPSMLLAIGLGGVAMVRSRRQKTQ